jgi:hypothetical protein
MAMHLCMHLCPYEDASVCMLQTFFCVLQPLQNSLSSVFHCRGLRSAENTACGPGLRGLNGVNAVVDVAPMMNNRKSSGGLQGLV